MRTSKVERAEIEQRVARLEEEAEKRREVVDRLLDAVSSPLLPPATRAAARERYLRELAAYREILAELDSLEDLLRSRGVTEDRDSQQG